MTITIIGWYGTETIGDRAILAGLFSFFHQSFGNFQINLGSLFPFFSDRTILEDSPFYKEILGVSLQIKIFNSKEHQILKENIHSSDLIVMGGGPLMDLEELFMVEYAFKLAKSLNKRTALLGCGVGPLFGKQYKKSVLKICSYSDIIILRDRISKNNLAKIYQTFNKSFPEKHIHTSYDPAVECALNFTAIHPQEQHDYIALNLRQFPIKYGNENRASSINDSLKLFVKTVASHYISKEIRLIPMHYFHIGGDDRTFLNKIALDLKMGNIHVQQKNLTLYETMQQFQSASLNIGMRFHAVVLQSIINGNNIILDYTEPKKGKIFGFLHDIDTDNFYHDRYISLQEHNPDAFLLPNNNQKFKYDIPLVKERLYQYVDKLKSL